MTERQFGESNATVSGSQVAIKCLVLVLLSSHLFRQAYGGRNTKWHDDWQSDSRSHDVRRHLKSAFLTSRPPCQTNRKRQRPWQVQTLNAVLFCTYGLQDGNEENWHPSETHVTPFPHSPSPPSQICLPSPLHTHTPAK